ncbi:hypothetical protein A0H81_01345 [Grifola frondosa]|uniref:Uncharacterized protein n=1 Tax=Grifola frondosa TaxID=5627 RepID=A0A1C7MS17_GRIFR|nr:hypothetical protein A0H81_01345 [Grifola frondosa]
MSTIPWYKWALTNSSVLFSPSACDNGSSSCVTLKRDLRDLTNIFALKLGRLEVVTGIVKSDSNEQLESTIDSGTVLAGDADTLS